MSSACDWTQQGRTTSCPSTLVRRFNVCCNLSTWCFGSTKRLQMHDLIACYSAGDFECQALVNQINKQHTVSNIVCTEV